MRKGTATEPDDLLVISCDDKGVVVRPDALRAATAQAAARSTTKLAGSRRARSATASAWL